MNLNTEINDIVEPAPVIRAVRGGSLRRIGVWGVVWRTVLVLILLMTFFPFIFPTYFKDTYQLDILCCLHSLRLTTTARFHGTWGICLTVYSLPPPVYSVFWSAPQ